MNKYILCALLGYFAGCFSPSYLLSRRRGFAIRTFGSGNAGATNMMLAAGLKPGLGVMALDVSKAFVVTFPLRLLLPPLCAALAGLLCVLGHIFPVFLHFRGGKGTACLCGTVLGQPPEQVLPAYIPDVPGKERRKRAPGKEGKLGVEGMPPEVLLEALRRAGAQAEDSPEPPDPITNTDLYLAGLSGGADSAARRRALQQVLGLPELLGSAGLLQALNLLMTREEFQHRYGELR